MLLIGEYPSLLFSTISLILLAYTNRFVAIANVIRELKKSYENNRKEIILKEIENLKFRIQLMKLMQLFGVKSLFLSVLTILLLFINFSLYEIINLKILTNIIFNISLLCLLISLGISIIEIFISNKALKIHLSDLQIKKD